MLAGKGKGSGGARPGAGRPPNWTRPARLEAKAARMLDQVRMMLERAAQLRHPASPNVPALPQGDTVAGFAVSALVDAP
jgi:hypothetical protein